MQQKNHSYPGMRAAIDLRHAVHDRTTEMHALRHNLSPVARITIYYSINPDIESNQGLTCSPRAMMTSLPGTDSHFFSRPSSAMHSDSLTCLSCQTS